MKLLIFLFVLIQSIQKIKATVKISSPSSPDCNRDSERTKLFKYLSKTSEWKYKKTIHVDFKTYHTQGLYKIKNNLFVTAVHITKQPTHFDNKTDALYDMNLDRSTGNGTGYLFKFHMNGTLIDSVELKHNHAYHAGGLDYDGEWLWVPLSEYRPNSYTVMIRVNPTTLKHEKIFDYPDHISAVYFNTRMDALFGLSWGSRRIYRWAVKYYCDGDEVAEITDTAPFIPNPQTMIDYQDCFYDGEEYAFCGGVSKYKVPGVEQDVAIGGIDLIDLRTNTIAHTLTAEAWIVEEIQENKQVKNGTKTTTKKVPNTSLSVLNNAWFMEAISNDTMRMYFQAETNGKGNVVVYDVTRHKDVVYPKCKHSHGYGSSSLVGFVFDSYKDKTVDYSCVDRKKKEKKDTGNSNEGVDAKKKYTKKVDAKYDDGYDDYYYYNDDGYDDGYEYDDGYYNRNTHHSSSSHHHHNDHHIRYDKYDDGYHY